ncbi:MAG: hypothetical protein M3R25_00080 [Bacteroidota bacterium]|nr:hypothetical protein [Bacteroidota bacterium]
MKKFSFLIFFSGCMLFTFCTSSKNLAGKKIDTPAYGYSKDISPILVQHCTPCHFPETGKKKQLSTYSAVHDNIDDILTRVQLPHDDPKFMPFKMKKEPLSDSLIMVLKVWKEQGMSK